MDKELLKIAAKAVTDVYAGKGQNIGSTEWANTVVEYQGRHLQVLAIAGTNEPIDWFWNLLLFSWDGVKIGSYLAANLIFSGTWGRFERIRKLLRLKSGPGFKHLAMPLLIACHSKSGPTGLYFKRKFGADYCVAFCPARGFRKPVRMENTTILIDLDDPVPMLGYLSFDHPDCERIDLPDDPGMSVSDHFMTHIDEYLKETV